jgi:hypothetical protein
MTSLVPGAPMNMSAQSVRLKRFDMKGIPQDAVCVFIGRRRTGKSTLVKDLLFHHRAMPMGTVISGTEESNSFYSKLIPPIFIHGEYSPAIISNFVKRQQLITKKIQQQETAGQGQLAQRSKLDPRSFLILETIASSCVEIKSFNAPCFVTIFHI